MAKGAPNSTALAVDWLERDKYFIDGLDHLGVQVISANLYSVLLPGITNVTDRARYYALYPWILYHFAQQRDVTRDPVHWLQCVRRLDFAYALACVAYEMTSGTFASRATAVVGSDTARRKLREAGLTGAVDVWHAARLDAVHKIPQTDAYFRNPEGGFGQYYKGALASLGLLVRDAMRRYPDCQLTSYAGVPVAQSVETQPAFRNLVALASSGHARTTELATLGARLHPSAIEPGSAEETLLRQLFLGADDNICRRQRPADRAWRRASLLLLLHYVRESEGLTQDSVVEELRWACTTLALPDGTRWNVPEALQPVASAWAAYHRNDLLNYALESVFWVALRRIEEGRFTPQTVAQYLAELASAEIPVSNDHPASPALSGRVSDWCASCTRPQRESEGDPWGHTSTRNWHRLLRAAVRAKEDPAVAGWAIRLLGRLASDHGSFRVHPFETMPQAPEMAAAHEVHLGRWLGRTADRASEPVSTFLEELIVEWILYRHLRVATRKLAGQGVSTFKFRPEQGALLLLVDEIPVPDFTNPRLRQAHRILGDLHYLMIDSAGTRLSADGAHLLTSIPL